MRQHYDIYRYGIYNAVAESEAMKNRWENYKNRNYYVGDLSWDDVTNACIELAEVIDSGPAQFFGM